MRGITVWDGRQWKKAVVRRWDGESWVALGDATGAAAVTAKIDAVASYLADLDERLRR